jgi:hypothetical protein
MCLIMVTDAHADNDAQDASCRRHGSGISLDEREICVCVYAMHDQVVMGFVFLTTLES